MKGSTTASGYDQSLIEISKEGIRIYSNPESDSPTYKITINDDYEISQAGINVFIKSSKINTPSNKINLGFNNNFNQKINEKFLIKISENNSSVANQLKKTEPKNEGVTPSKVAWAALEMASPTILPGNSLGDLKNDMSNVKISEERANNAIEAMNKFGFKITKRSSNNKTNVKLFSYLMIPITLSVLVFILFNALGLPIIIGVILMVIILAVGTLLASKFSQS
jgi:hypothetical protein